MGIIFVLLVRHQRVHHYLIMSQRFVFIDFWKPLKYFLLFQIVKVSPFDFKMVYHYVFVFVTIIFFSDIRISLRQWFESFLVIKHTKILSTELAISNPSIKWFRPFFWSSKYHFLQFWSLVLANGAVGKYYSSNWKKSFLI